MNERLGSISFKSIFSLVLAVISLHFIVLSFVIPSRTTIVIAGLDAIMAMILGLRTDDNVGHAGLVLGIVLFLVTLGASFLLFA